VVERANATHAFAFERPKLFSCVMFNELPDSIGERAFGVCVRSARVGDKIVLVRGCSFPALLRERPGALGTYIYLKEAYLPGFMDGECSGRFEEKLFEIN